MNYTVYITAKCQPRYRNNPDMLELKVQKIEQLYDVKQNRLERFTISMDATALDEAFVSELATASRNISVTHNFTYSCEHLTTQFLC